MTELTTVDRLAFLAFQLLLPGEYPKRKGEVEALPTGPHAAHFGRVTLAVQEVWNGLDPDDQRPLRNVSKEVDDPAKRNKPRLISRLRWLLAEPYLATISGEQPAEDAVDEKVALAAARTGAGLGTKEDQEALLAWSSTPEGGQPDVPDENPGEDTEMTEDTTSPATEAELASNKPDPSPEPVFIGSYRIDTRFTPETFDADRFRDAILRRFRDRDIDLKSNEAQAHGAYVAGSLLADSYFDPRSPGFDDVFVEHFDKGFVRVEVKPAPRVNVAAAAVARKHKRSIEVYLAVANKLTELKNDEPPSVQEVAAISDDVLERGPVDDNFDAKVRSAFDDFVGKTPVFDSLGLPSLVLEENSEGVFEPKNIRATSMIGASMHLDRAGLMAAVDTSAQDWSDGVLPVGDSAGRLYDPYVWDARDRLDPSARQIQYDRIKELDDYVLRFCSAVSERDRGLYLSEYLTGPGREHRSPQPQDASVRKCARDLLAYASLHGWAYSQFAAKRIGNHIRQCVEIIENSEVQKAYGVPGPWQVVERINTMSVGSSPNITKELTLASTGKEIVDILAAKATAIAANLASIPLFPTLMANQGGRTTVRRAVFTDGEYQTLLVLVENWLAANAITDSQRFDAAQPREVPASTSLPNVGGGFMGADPSAVKDQLMQMVNAGQLPTVDQVNSLFNRQN